MARIDAMLCCHAGRVCAVAQSRGPACGDPTAEARKGNAVNGAHVARSRVASTLYERGACSTVCVPNPAVRRFAPGANFAIVVNGSHLQLKQ